MTNALEAGRLREKSTTPGNCSMTNIWAPEPDAPPPPWVPLEVVLEPDEEVDELDMPPALPLEPELPPELDELPPEPPPALPLEQDCAWVSVAPKQIRVRLCVPPLQVENAENPEVQETAVVWFSELLFDAVALALALASVATTA